MDMNPLIQKSPYGGSLFLETVKGSTSGVINPENNIDTKLGNDRTMYTYVPVSGCPHAKQCAVLYVLRDEDTKESAEKLLKELKLDELAEEYHFIILFPNPENGTWNYKGEEGKEDDAAFLARCFAALPVSQGRVAGFNGMMYYIGTTPASSALITYLAKKQPLDAAGIMIGKFPEDYQILERYNARQNAWIYDGNTEALRNLVDVNDVYSEDDGVYLNPDDPNIKVVFNDDGLSAKEVRDCYEQLFCFTRRWRNDTFGTYQNRIDFVKKGFVPHYKDASLKANDGFEHTWYEYVPESVKASGRKVPLVFFFHGINCVPLYGAEQSGWADIADKEGFACVFPEASIENRWNVWDDPRLPSDVDFVLALVKHMEETYPIDEERIYISGFSMGSLFTNALSSAYPDVFAAAAPFNGANWGYTATLDSMKGMLLAFRKNSIVKDFEDSGEKESVIRKLADKKKAEYDYRMPLIQSVGLEDNIGLSKGVSYPVHSFDGNDWAPLVRFWLGYNHMKEAEPFFNAEYESGLNGEENYYEKERFLHHVWKDEEGESRYQFVAAKREPHAVDLRGIRIAWEFMKHFARKGKESVRIG